VLEAVPGLDGVWAFREDLAGTLMGGNKLRKLEGLLGAALVEGAEVLSLGPAGSNFLAALAAHGARAGVKVQSIVVPQPDHPYARVNARAIHAWSDRVWTASHASLAPVVAGQALAAARLVARARPRWVAPGGSELAGTLGWVDAGVEIARRVAAAEAPEPKRVYVALGTGGTAAGLLVGLRLGGLGSEVVAVRATPLAVGNGAVVRRLAEEAIGALRSAGLPRPRLDGLRVAHAQYGEGYAIPTVSSLRAQRVAAESGLPLDPTYTARAFAQLLTDRDRDPNGEALFVHTANNLTPDELLRGALDAVPWSMRGLLRGQ
jgi:1-aminocyclopropane-1-carboxylate deaminase/D-cysteine desulfhydrase-like pyridoxal-dependent ACC family enzyme